MMMIMMMSAVAPELEGPPPPQVESESSTEEDELPKETQPLLKSVTIAPVTMMSDDRAMDTSHESGELRERKADDSDEDADGTRSEDEYSDNVSPRCPDSKYWSLVLAVKMMGVRDRLCTQPRSVTWLIACRLTQWHGSLLSLGCLVQTQVFTGRCHIAGNLKTLSCFLVLTLK